MDGIATTKGNYVRKMYISKITAATIDDKKLIKQRFTLPNNMKHFYTYSQFCFSIHIIGQQNKCKIICKDLKKPVRANRDYLNAINSYRKVVAIDVK